LKQISLGFETTVKAESVYRRIQRFFKIFNFSQKLVAKFVLKKIPLTKYTLSMDRTNWQFGKLNINILAVGIVYKKIAFPIAWTLVDKKGNSNTEERIKIMEKVLEIIPKEKIENLLADREFIGKKWFSWLIDHEISFVIRIKDNFKITRRGQTRAIKTSFRCVKDLQSMAIKESLEICGVKLFVTGTRVKGEFCIVVSQNSQEKSINIYLKRWAIETFFGCIKSKGFNMENTHMTDKKRISKLLALVIIAFTWAHFMGEFLNNSKPIKIKNHGRKSISLFHLGLNFLQRIFINFSLYSSDFKRAVTFLSCT
jgi:hypothetical protein